MPSQYPDTEELLEEIRECSEPNGEYLTKNHRIAAVTGEFPDNRGPSDFFGEIGERRFVGLATRLRYLLDDIALLNLMEEKENVSSDADSTYLDTLDEPDCVPLKRENGLGVSIKPDQDRRSTAPGTQREATIGYDIGAALHVLFGDMQQKQNVALLTGVLLGFYRETQNEPIFRADAHEEVTKIQHNTNQLMKEMSASADITRTAEEQLETLVHEFFQNYVQDTEVLPLSSITISGLREKVREEGLPYPIRKSSPPRLDPKLQTIDYDELRKLINATLSDAVDVERLTLLGELRQMIEEDVETVENSDFRGAFYEDVIHEIWERSNENRALKFNQLYTPGHNMEDMYKTVIRRVSGHRKHELKTNRELLDTPGENKYRPSDYGRLVLHSLFELDGDCSWVYRYSPVFNDCLYRDSEPGEGSDLDPELIDIIGEQLAIIEDDHLDES